MAANLLNKVYFVERKQTYEWRDTETYCPMCGKQRVFELNDRDSVIKKRACVECKKHFDVYIGDKDTDPDEAFFDFDDILS